MARSKKSSSKASNRQKKRAQAEGTVSLDHLIQQGEHYIQAGEAQQALPSLEKAVKHHPYNLNARLLLSRALYILGRYQPAFEHSERLATQFSHDASLLAWHASVLEKLRRHGEAIEWLKKSLKIVPRDVGAHNNIATLYVREGNYLLAEQHFQKAWELQPENDLPRSNMVASKHYNPAYSAEELHQDTLEWERLFAPTSKSVRADTDRSTQRRLRLGLISGGLRMHPVGQMILPAIKALDDLEFEVFVYTTNEISDVITDEFKQKAHHWNAIDHLSHEATAEKIRNDKIDILVDLNGGGEGSRFKTLILEPAPLQVKWVGSLFNTTGLSCVDYLISDAIETPEGVDHRYTEHLIRMPDDYICYHRPEHAPATSALPALKNGHITFGCLNNPAKLNDELLAQWAKLLQDVAGSHLLLRGAQFENPGFCDRIHQTFKEHGIDEQRLILEGPIHHQDFLATYNRIDIALDTWPYSGGLTTCEALLMGVPVVTLPGPTFAGRHSATHLTNAGMPELVTNSWDEYRQRAIELAANLPDLSVIRACLRTYLLQSPVCDGPRFGKHLTTALRAIWQRHCEGKAPAALTFNKGGEAYFEGEEKPVNILPASPYHESQNKDAEFQWHIDGKIIAIDNGASLATSSTTPELMKSDALALIAFDPASRISDTAPLQTGGELHHYPHTLLGDGNPATLYVCLDPAMSATLEPLPAEQQPQGQGQGSQVLTTLPIQTIQLDSIEGLEGIDWLVLDNLNDNLAVLEHGEKALKNLLVLQARINFVATHQHQPDFAQISQWANDHGLRFLRFNTLAYQGSSPEGEPQVQHSQLASADALFIPESARMAELGANQHKKLAYLLHSAYAASDMAHDALSRQDEQQAQDYWQYCKKSVAPLPATKIPVAIHDRSHLPNDASSTRVFNQIEYPLIYNIEILNNEIIDNALAKVGAKKKAVNGIEGLLSAASRRNAKEEIFFTGHSFYNATVNSPPYVIKQNVFDLYGITPFSIVDDHAYADFMLSRCHNSPDSIIIGSKSARLIEEFKQVSNANKIKGIVIPHKSPEKDPVLYKDKQNIAVFVGKLYPNVPKSTTSIVNTVAKEKQIPKGQQQAILEFIEKRRSDPFAEPTLERGVTSETTLLYFDLVDKHFRNKYRTAELEKLSRALAARGIKTVIIGGKKSEWPFKQDHGCEFHERMEYGKTLHIMNSARYNINLTPSYPDIFTDRAINMMGSNSLCLSDYTPFLEAHNKEALYFGHEWLENDFKESDCQELAMKQKLEILKTYNSAKIENAWVACLEQVFNR
nr:tetratricopeptide repeat protein [uncultured Halomonas sp.]